MVNKAPYRKIKKIIIDKAKIPKIWDYSHTDKTTHLYLNCSKGHSTTSVKWIINPHFRFKDQVTWIDWSNINENISDKKLYKAINQGHTNRERKDDISKIIKS